VPLQLGEELGLTLSADETKHFKLYKYTIEERIRPALQLLKLTARSAPQRTALHIALGLVMPRPEDKQLHALSKILGFSYGNRSERLNNSQPFAADVAFKTRVLFDEARVLHFAFVEAARTRNFARLQQLLQPGAKVICGSDGTMAELVRFTAEGGCVLRFAYGDICEEQTFSSVVGARPGSARLRLPPPSLEPPARQIRSDAIPAATRTLVLRHAEKHCAVSPCKVDAVKRHVAARVWETRQALILLFPVYTLMAYFFLEHPSLLGRTAYLKVLREEVWHLKHAYRETCLCRTCFNLRLFREALKVLGRA
jgi:hypothetical protein